MLKRNWMIIVLVVFCCVSCTKQPVVNHNNDVLPKQFVNVYMFADYSKQFSDVVGQLTADLYEANYINEEEKNEIGKVWKEHKLIVNKLQKQIDNWYYDIDNGVELSINKRMYASMKDIILNTNVLYDFINKYSEENDIYIPEQLPNRLFDIYGKIRGYDE